MDIATGFLLCFLYSFAGAAIMNALYLATLSVARVSESLFSPYAARLDYAAFARATHYLPILAIYQAPRDLALSDAKFVLLAGFVAPLLEELCFFAVPAIATVATGFPAIILTAGAWIALHVISDWWIVENGERPVAIALDALGFSIDAFIDATCWLGQFGLALLPFLAPQYLPGVARTLSHMLLNTIISIKEVKALKEMVRALRVESPYLGESDYL